MPLLREEDLENICGGCRKPLEGKAISIWCGSIRYDSRECLNPDCVYKEKNDTRVVDGSGIE
ncbi:MAG: hypothetical protein ABH828_02235 [archaeon]